MCSFLSYGTVHLPKQVKLFCMITGNLWSEILVTGKSYIQAFMKANIIFVFINVFPIYILVYTCRNIILVKVSLCQQCLKACKCYVYSYMRMCTRSKNYPYSSTGKHQHGGLFIIYITKYPVEH